MDAEQALELVKHGSTLLLLDVPQHTLIGIDTQIFFAGPVFMGIKMIPPGVHFIYYSSSSREGKDFSPMIGFFVETSPSEVVIRRWNPLEERLVKVSEEEEKSDSFKKTCVYHLPFEWEFDRMKPSFVEILYVKGELVK
ncbi:AAR2-like protein, partial [Drosera capensis]